MAAARGEGDKGKGGRGQGQGRGQQGREGKGKGGAVVASTTLVSAMDVVVRLLLLDSFSFWVFRECVFLWGLGSDLMEGWSGGSQ